VIAFLVGVVTGSVCTWYLVRKRLASWRESRDWWRDVAAQRAVELKPGSRHRDEADPEAKRRRPAGRGPVSPAEWVSVTVLAALLSALFVKGLRGELRAQARRAERARRARLARHRMRLIKGQEAARQLGVPEPEWDEIVRMLTDREDA
jgi:hypothetical protein